MNEEFHQFSKNVCPKCGSGLFHAVPHETSVHEIEEFYRYKAWQVEESTWIHPGAYCWECDWGVTATYALPDSGLSHKYEDIPEYYLVRIRSECANRIELMALVRKFNPRTAKEIKALIGKPGSVIARVRWDQIDSMKNNFDEIGAEIEFEPILNEP